MLEPVVSVSINRFEFDGDPRYGHNWLPADAEILNAGAPRSVYAGVRWRLE